MRKQSMLAIVFTLGLLIPAVFTTFVLADQKTGEKQSEGETVAQATAPDEMTKILGHYFAIRELLAHDKTEGVAKEAKQMTQRLDELIRALQAIRTPSDGLKTDDLEIAREGFGPLSDAVLSYVKEFGFSGKAYSFYCSMVENGWLQEHDQIGNPYYGSEMYKCGEMTGMVMMGRFMDKTKEPEHGMQLEEMQGK